MIDISRFFEKNRRKSNIKLSPAFRKFSRLRNQILSVKHSCLRTQIKEPPGRIRYGIINTAGGFANKTKCFAFLPRPGGKNLAIN